MTNSIRNGLIGLICLMALNTAQADRIWLDNGDSISGDIVRKQDDVLIFKTTYAGEIKIAWKQVTSIQSDTPVKVILRDNTRLNAVIQQAEQGTASFKQGDIMTTAPINLADVKYLNPPPAVTGEGVRLKGRINVGLNKTTGNTDTEKYHVDTELVARTKSNRYTLGAEFNQETDGANETANNSLGYMKYDHFLSEKRYFYANGTFAKDKFADLNLRSSVGVGLGHQFVESDDKNLSLEGGISYVNEDFISSQDADYAALRWALNYDEMFFKKRVQFFHNHDGLLGLEDSDDIVIYTRTGLRFPIVDNMNTTLQVNADWDNTPAAGKEKTDVEYLFTLGYSW